MKNGVQGFSCREVSSTLTRLPSLETRLGNPCRAGFYKEKSSGTRGAQAWSSFCRAAESRLLGFVRRQITVCSEDARGRTLESATKPTRACAALQPHRQWRREGFVRLRKMALLGWSLENGGFIGCCREILSTFLCVIISIWDFPENRGTEQKDCGCRAP